MYSSLLGAVPQLVPPNPSSILVEDFSYCKMAPRTVEFLTDVEGNWEYMAFRQQRCEGAISNDYAGQPLEPLGWCCIHASSLLTIQNDLCLMVRTPSSLIASTLPGAPCP